MPETNKTYNHPQITSLYKLYLSETQPFRKVHRMIDLFETIIKMHTVVILAEYFKYNKLSESAKGLLSQGLRTPSLGTWQLFSRVLFSELQNETYSWTIEEIETDFIISDNELNSGLLKGKIIFPTYDKEKLNNLKALRKLRKSNFDDVIALRNSYAHGATPTDESCLIDIKIYEPFLVQLVQLNWIKNSSLVLENNQVVLNYQSKKLSLHPLLLYRKEANEASFAFFNDIKKDDKISLLNYPLGKHYREKEFYQEFQNYLPLNEWKKSGTNDFQQRVEELTETFKGRVVEREKLLNFVSNHNKGYLSIQGNPGIGKSALIAQFFKDLKANETFKNIRVVEYFIRRGTSQAQTEYLFNYLNHKTDELFPKAKEIKAEGKMVFDLQNQLLNKWRLWAEHNNGNTILFLIDGLDEGVENNLVNYLPRENFQNILFIYGSRPGGHKSIDELWGSLPIENHIKLELGGLGKEDIRAMIYEVANKYELERESVWIDAVQVRSQGNPLYLKLLCDAIANNSIGINDIHALPKEIDDYYKAILQRYAQDTLDGDDLLMALYTFAAAKDYLTLAHIGLINQLGEAKLQRIGSTLKEVLYENPLTENVLDYQLFHESFREYLCREKAFKISEAKEQIINFCGTWKELAGTWEQCYTLEHYASHLSESNKASNHETLLKLIYNNEYINTQKQVLRHFNASNRLMQLALLKSGEVENQETMLEAALCLVDLKYEEANDAPRIVEMVANNEMDLALMRIENFGGNEKEGLQQKFILYMLCLMELTLLESKHKPFRKEAIEKLLKHLDENLPVDHSVLNWNHFFSSYIVFLMASEWAEMSLDYRVVYKRTSTWNINWLPKIELISKQQINLLENCSSLVYENDELRKILIGITIEYAKQGDFKYSLQLIKKGFASNPDLSDDLWECKLYCIISTKLHLQENFVEAENYMKSALGLANEIILPSEKCESYCKISTELFKQYKVEEANAIMNEAVNIANEITETEEKCKAFIFVFSELYKQGLNVEANTIYKNTIELSDAINEGFYSWKSTIQMQIYTEIARCGETEKALIGIQSIKDDVQKNIGLIFIYTILVEERKFELASSVINEVIKFINSDKNDFLKFILINLLSTELAKHKSFNDLISLLIESLKRKTIQIDVLVKNERLIEIKFGLLNRKLKEQFNIVSKEILNNSEFLEDAVPLCKVANSNFIDNQHEEASTTIEKALFYARKIEDVYIKCIEIATISTELSKQGKFEFAASLINEALEYAKGANELYEGQTRFDICLELLNQNRIDEAIEISKQIQDKAFKISCLTFIATFSASSNKIESEVLMSEALNSVKDINYSDVAKVLSDLSINLFKQGQTELALKYIKDISDEYYKNSALKEISLQLAKQNNWQHSESTGLEISQIAIRNECWNSIAQYTYKQLGWTKALAISSQWQNEDVRSNYIKGLAENINVNDANLNNLVEFLPFIINDTNSIEAVLQAYGLNEIFFNQPNGKLINRLNRSLNLQWAIDISSKFEKEFERASHNLQEWINEIEDENDREDVLSWAEKVAQGKMTEEKFLDKINKL